MTKKELPSTKKYIEGRKYVVVALRLAEERDDEEIRKMLAKALSHLHRVSL